MNDTTRRFWNEIRKIKSKAKSKNPPQIDNVCGNENVANLFAEKFESLYNSVPFNVDEMYKLVNDVNHRINSESIPANSWVISPEVIKTAISKIKAEKNRR